MIESKQGMSAEKGSEGTSKTNTTLMLGWIPKEALLIARGIPDTYLLFAGQSQTEVREKPSCWYHA
jgi:hypothetical protein